MEINGAIKQANEHEITIRTKDRVNLRELNQKAIGKHIYVNADVYEPDTTTNLQRKHFYALMGDYEFYTGVPLEAAESWFKYQFMLEEDLDQFPSLARNQMKKSTATEFLTFVITYMIQNDIPFKDDRYYLTVDQNRMLYALTMKRLCWVKGTEHAQLHHAINLVQMGNDRRKHNHLKSKFMMLSTEAHQEAHWMGLEEFCKKHHVYPISLKEEDLRQLNIQGNYEKERYTWH